MMDIDLTKYNFSKNSWLTQEMINLELNFNIGVCDAFFNVFLPEFIINDSKLILNKLTADPRHEEANILRSQFNYPVFCEWVSGNFSLGFGDYYVRQGDVSGHKHFKKHMLLKIKNGVVLYFKEDSLKERLYMSIVGSNSVFAELSEETKENILSIVEDIKKDQGLMQQLETTDNVPIQDTGFSLAFIKSFANVFGYQSEELVGLIRDPFSLNNIEYAIYQYIKADIYGDRWLFNLYLSS